METLWRAWGEHPGTRTLVFCCSIAHAELRARHGCASTGVRVEGRLLGRGLGRSRRCALRELAAGEIDAVCSVDVFNEGVDVPSIDRVVMLRPTESGVIFLQQLGRGLRAAAGKTRSRSSTSSATTASSSSACGRCSRSAGRDAPAICEGSSASDEPIELPAGCSVELELEAKELLARLFRVSGADEVERIYRELPTERGERPTAGELERMGYPPSPLRERATAAGSTSLLGEVTSTPTRRSAVVAARRASSASSRRPR